jgi:hypothetical protein
MPATERTGPLAPDAPAIPTPEHALAREPRVDHAAAIRRLDWRFLLPRPDLGSVAFVGAVDSTLLRALRNEGFDVRACTAAAIDMHGKGTVDTCVLQSSSPAAVADAIRLLRPGGWLYWEPTSASLGLMASLRDGSAFRTAAGLSRLLTRHGVLNVTAAIHYPSFGSCRRIIPLASRTALRALLTERVALPATFARMATRIVSAGLVPVAGVSLSFVAMRPNRADVAVA